MLAKPVRNFPDVFDVQHRTKSYQNHSQHPQPSLNSKCNSTKPVITSHVNKMHSQTADVIKWQVRLILCYVGKGNEWEDFGGPAAGLNSDDTGSIWNNCFLWVGEGQRGRWWLDLQVEVVAAGRSKNGELVDDEQTLRQTLCNPLLTAFLNCSFHFLTKSNLQLSY